MKRKSWCTISTIYKTTIYDVGNPGIGLGQAAHVAELNQRKPPTCCKTLTTLDHTMLHLVHLAMSEIRTRNVSGDTTTPSLDNSMSNGNTFWLYIFTNMYF